MNNFVLPVLSPLPLMVLLLRFQVLKTALQIMRKFEKDNLTKAL